MTTERTDNADATIQALIGAWSLDSFVETNLSTNVSHEPFGKAPRGYITFGPEGRILVVITADGRQAPHDLKSVSEADRVRLYDTVMAYGGTYECKGPGHVVFTIDISWNEKWTGEVQDRFVELSGNRLNITVGPQIGISGQLIKAVLSWTRVVKANERSN